VSGPASPSATNSATSTPPCGWLDLGNAGSASNAPDQQGRVWGSIGVMNVSGHPCLLPGPGALATSSSTRGSVRVLQHTPGDPAAGLPATGTALPAALRAGANYTQQWVWIPDAPCPPPPSSQPPTSSPSASPGAAAAAAASTGPAASGSATPVIVPSPGGPSPSTAATVTFFLRAIDAANPLMATSFSISNTCGSGALYLGAVFVDP
jgi:hypothetical protein